MVELSLPRIGYGTAGLGNHLTAVSDAEAQVLLQAAWDSGVRLFDTAPHYGLGLSERRLGAFLAGKPRDTFVVSTKVGRLLLPNPAAADDIDDEDFVVPADHKRVWDFSATGVRESLDGSLDRLGLASIDVVYLHDPERWDLRPALTDGLAALSDLRSTGAIQAVGVASMSTVALLAAAESGLIDLVMSAGRFTLADQAAAAQVLPACLQNGVGVVAAAVFNGGLLATTPTEASTFDYRAVPSDVLQRARRIEAVCATYGVPLRVAALQYPLRHGAVRAVVVGGADPEQIRHNTNALDSPIPTELWVQLRAESLVST